MSELHRRMREDRYLRDSAKALFDADFDQLKTGLTQKGFAAMAIDTVRDGAVDIYEEALEVAEDHKGALAALLAAILVWFARNPLLSLIGLGDESDEEQEH